jgi:hypothetical protein
VKEEILALLEEKPYRVVDLAIALGRSRDRVYELLCDLRAHGQVQNVGWQWALPGAQVTSYQYRICERCTKTFIRTPGSTGKWCSPVCARPPKVEPEPEPELVMRPAEVEVPPPMPARIYPTRTVGDEEFEVVWSGRDSLTGPMNGMGSSLSGLHRLLGLK